MIQRAFRIGDPKNSGKAMIIALFGHELEDEELLRECRQTYEDIVDSSTKLQKLSRVAWVSSACVMLIYTVVLTSLGRGALFADCKRMFLQWHVLSLEAY